MEVLASVGSLETRQAAEMALWTGTRVLNSRRTNLIGEGAGGNRVGQRRLKFEGTKPLETETWDGLLGAAADALVGADLKIVRANVDEDLPLIVAAAISDSDLNSTLKPL